MKTLAILFSALFALACATTGTPVAGVREAAPAKTLATARMIDLSHSFDSDTIYWPNSPTTFQLERQSYGKTPAGFFYASNTFCTPEHGGTHLDAPIHFGEGKWTTDQIPVERLIRPAVLIDISAKAETDPDYRLTREDVEAWEKNHGQIPSGSIVLLRTGWSSRWPERKRYLGDDTPGDASNLHFPSYGESAARILVDERHVSVLGIDTASIDHGPSTDFIVHQIANGANVPGLENLTNLDSVPATGAWIIALPMKIAGGSGGPLRAVALVWE